jgi:hypothetical protein
MASIRMPPGIGKLLEEPLLYNEYQQRFTRARRMRFCLNCKTMGAMNEMGQFTCQKCGLEHNGRWGNLGAPRAFTNFLLLSGRGGGKTLIGAHAVREELMIPGAVWWAMGASYKLLWDSTFPTLVGLLHPQWIKQWDSEHVEITLKNDAKVAFRSLEDPDRARGPHGCAGMWFDEAAQCPERAWHVGTPMLIKAGGIAIASTTVLGYDWTYEQLEKRALVYREPGYFTAKWKTVDNPLFRTNPVMAAAIEKHRKTMPAPLFKQEYEAERANAEGLIYGELADQAWLADDAAVKRYIPEWPAIHPHRKVLIGIDEGGDHPSGCVLIVVTDTALIVVGEFLERMKAHSLLHDAVWRNFALHRFQDKTFAANKNALQLRLEWAVKGTGIIKAESKQEVGIQRTQSWLVTKRLKIAYTCPRTKEQMVAYRYSDNTKNDGSKKEQEGVFKLKDELPDAIRYALMAWPELPDPDKEPMSDAEAARLSAFDDKTRRELEIMEEMRKKKRGSDLHLEPGEQGFPAGNVYQHGDVSDFFGGDF